MYKPVIIFILLYLCSLDLQGQVPMEDGFAMLENQEYSDAERFFAGVLDQNPDNITANICHSRALGLGGKSKDALDQLESLYTTHPQNFEIGLNVAEAYMWNKQYAEALQLYKALYPSHPNDFVVNQGIANASASLHDNVTALRFIKKALQIHPQNKGAKLSAKYIRLARSEELHKEKNLPEAHRQLDSILMDFVDDREALLKRTNIYLTTDQYGMAAEIYTLLHHNKIDIYEGLAGLSYTSKLRLKNKEALSYAKTAFAYAQKINDSKILLRAYIGLIGAHGINRDFKSSFSLLQDAQQRYPNNVKLDLTAARMHLWNRDYQKAMDIYTQIESIDHNFEYHLGLAELHRATKKINKAKRKVLDGLDLYPNDVNASRFLAELNRMQQPTLTLGHFGSSDNGQNTAWESIVGLSLNNKKNITPNLYYKRRTSSDVNQQQARQNIAGLGITYEPNYRFTTTVKSEITTNAKIDSSAEINYSYHIGQDVLLGKYHQVQLSTIKHFYNYTTDLIQSNLSIQDYVAQYQYTRPKLPNLFVQYIYAHQSDHNTKNLVYGSLYYTLIDYPNIKAGINYLQMGFAEERAELYFSPEQFRNMEVFAQIDTRTIKRNKWYLIVLGGLGRQEIDDEAPQSTIRGEITAGFQITPSLLLESKYAYNTSAHSTAVGFTFQRAGIQLHYLITE